MQLEAKLIDVHRGHSNNFPLIYGALRQEYPDYSLKIYNTSNCLKITASSWLGIREAIWILVNRLKDHVLRVKLLYLKQNEKTF